MLTGSINTLDLYHLRTGHDDDSGTYNRMRQTGDDRECGGVVQLSDINDNLHCVQH